VRKCRTTTSEKANIPHTIRTIAKHAIADMIIHLLEEITKLSKRCRRIHCMFRNLLKGGSLSHFLPIELA
jgi:hypothetical protein